jgi:hypothetical protein
MRSQLVRISIEKHTPPAGSDERSQSAKSDATGSTKSPCSGVPMTKWRLEILGRRPGLGQYGRSRSAI